MGNLSLPGKGKVLYQHAVNNTLQRPKALEMGVGWKERGRWRGGKDRIAGG